MKFSTDKFLMACFYISMVLIIGAGYCICAPKFRGMRDLRAERERVRRRIEEKRAEIAKIKSWQRRFNTDREFVEGIARKRRRVFPGELVFVFEDSKQ